MYRIGHGISLSWISFLAHHLFLSLLVIAPKLTGKLKCPCAGHNGDCPELMPSWLSEIRPTGLP